MMDGKPLVNSFAFVDILSTVRQQSAFNEQSISNLATIWGLAVDDVTARPPAPVLCCSIPVGGQRRAHQPSWRTL